MTDGWGRQNERPEKVRDEEVAMEEEEEEATKREKCREKDGEIQRERQERGRGEWVMEMERIGNRKQKI